MTLKGITKEFEARFEAIEKRQNSLMKKFDELKPLLIKYEESIKDVS